MTAAESHLLSLQWLQDTREYSDLKTICGDETFHVHKAIICSRSKWFHAVCKPEWGPVGTLKLFNPLTGLEQDGKPKQEAYLEDEDPVVVGSMIDYLYQMDYDDALPSRRAAEIQAEGAETPNVLSALSPKDETMTYNEEPAEPESNIVTDEWGFSQASVPTESYDNDTWDFPKVDEKKKRRKNFRWPDPEPGPEISYDEPDAGTNPNMKRLPLNALMYALADKYEIEHLKTLARTKFEQAAEDAFSAQAFAHAAHLVFTTTPSTDEGLRSIVAYILSQHRNLVIYEGMSGLLDSGNGMAWALIRALL